MHSIIYIFIENTQKPNFYIKFIIFLFIFHSSMNPNNEKEKDNSFNLLTNDVTQETNDFKSRPSASPLEDPLLGGPLIHNKNKKNQKIKSFDQASKKTAHLKFKATYEVNEHMQSLDELSIRYDTHLDIMNPNNSKGLTRDKVKALQLKYGKNVLSPPKQKSEFEKFCAHLLNMFNLLLAGAGVLSFIAYIIQQDQPINLYLGIFLFAIVLADCIIGYVQERSSSNVMGKFKNLLPPKCRVIREGMEDEIKAEELVIGDIVKVNGGDKIPADLRVIINNGLKVEQSALNGESEPVEVSEKSLHTDFLESKNIIFNGCLCLEGMAKGVVIKTGDNTFLGIVAQQTAQIDHEETPLQKEVGKFVKLIGILGLTMGAIVFTIGCLRYRFGPNKGSDDSTYLNLFVNGFIIIIIANVPQGLPATVILCLTIIAKRLAHKQIFVKKLECIETLGSASVIASDKTGTLTMNQMTVEHLWFDGQLYSADHIKESKRELKNNKAWNIMYKVAALCNRSFLKKPHNESIVDPHGNFDDKDSLLMIQELGIDQNSKLKKTLISSKKSNILIDEYKKSTGSFLGQDNNLKNLSLSSDDILHDIRKINNESIKSFIKEKEKRKNYEIIGDASEQALMRFCEDFKNTDLYKMKYPKLFEVPFNSKNKFQISIHEVQGNRFVVMKGAPEIIVKRCSHYLQGQRNYPIDEQ